MNPTKEPPVRVRTTEVLKLVKNWVFDREMRSLGDVLRTQEESIRFPMLSIFWDLTIAWNRNRWDSHYIFTVRGQELDKILLIMNRTVRAMSLKFKLILRHTQSRNRESKLQQAGIKVLPTFASKWEQNYLYFVRREFLNAWVSSFCFLLTSIPLSDYSNWVCILQFYFKKWFDIKGFLLILLPTHFIAI